MIFFKRKPYTNIVTQQQEQMNNEQCFQQTTKQRRRGQKGLSLIEASMVLALAAVVVAGVMFYYQSASDSNKLQATNSELMSIIGEVNSLYAGQSDFGGITPNIIARTSAVTSNMIVDDGKGAKSIRTPFDGTIDIKETADKKAYDLTMNGLPAGACISLASTPLGNSLQSINVNAGTPSAKVLTPGDAATACAKDDKTNSIVWELH